MSALGVILTLLSAGRGTGDNARLRGGGYNSSPAVIGDGCLSLGDEANNSSCQLEGRSASGRLKDSGDGELGRHGFVCVRLMGSERSGIWGTLVVLSSVPGGGDLVGSFDSACDTAVRLGSSDSIKRGGPSSGTLYSVRRAGLRASNPFGPSRVEPWREFIHTERTRRGCKRPSVPSVGIAPFSILRKTVPTKAAWRPSITIQISFSRNRLNTPSDVSRGRNPPCGCPVSPWREGHSSK